MAEWLRRTPAKCIPKGARVRTSAVTAFLFAFSSVLWVPPASPGSCPSNPALTLSTWTASVMLCCALSGCDTDPILLALTASSPPLLQAALRGRPGAAYIDIPSNVLMAPLPANLTPSQVGAARCCGGIHNPDVAMWLERLFLAVVVLAHQADFVFTLTLTLTPTPTLNLPLTLSCSH